MTARLPLRWPWNGRCAKTQLLEILATLVRRGWHAVNPSVAVLYRKIDRQMPTLLLDEMDNYPVDERRDALSVLNAGYKRGATIDRCRENGDLESFSAYCPKGYAGLDKNQIVDTLLSRSITIRLEKRLPTESVEMWIGQLTEHQAEPLRERCEAWAAQSVAALYGSEPKLPPGMINRAAEVWWALLAIADLVGGRHELAQRRACSLPEVTTVMIVVIKSSCWLTCSPPSPIATPSLPPSCWRP